MLHQSGLKNRRARTLATRFGPDRRIKIKKGICSGRITAAPNHSARGAIRVCQHATRIAKWPIVRKKKEQKQRKQKQKSGMCPAAFFFKSFQILFIIIQFSSSLRPDFAYFLFNVIITRKTDTHQNYKDTGKKCSKKKWVFSHAGIETMTRNTYSRHCWQFYSDLLTSLLK